VLPAEFDCEDTPVSALLTPSEYTLTSYSLSSDPFVDSIFTLTVS
jgi:hypothetical protein